MAPLNPTSNKCYAASFPDSHADDRFNLKVRTGAATCIVHSRIFVHGGLTVPLELQEVTMAAITEQLTPLGPEHLSDWISNEVFELNIVERKWTRREWRLKKVSRHPLKDLPQGFSIRWPVKAGISIYLAGWC